MPLVLHLRKTKEEEEEEEEEGEAEEGEEATSLHLLAFPHLLLENYDINS